MSLQKAFGQAVFNVIGAIFPQPNGVGLVIHDDVSKLFLFRFNGRPQQQSDTVSDLAEMAIREVEKWIQEKIAEGGGVYYTHTFKGQLSARQAECFPLLDRPQRIEFYADTFRKGIAKLRKSYGVDHG